MGENCPLLWTIMKMKKMRTLDTRSINTFSTSIRMLRGAKASFLALFLDSVIGYMGYWQLFNLNLIFTIETEIVTKENNIDRVLYVTSSSSLTPFARNSFKISGRLKLLCSQNWK